MQYQSLKKRILDKIKYYEQDIHNTEIGYLINFLDQNPYSDLTWYHIKISDIAKLLKIEKGTYESGDYNLDILDYIPADHFKLFCIHIDTNKDLLNAARFLYSLYDNKSLNSKAYISFKNGEYVPTNYTFSHFQKLVDYLNVDFTPNDYSLLALAMLANREFTECDDMLTNKPKDKGFYVDDQPVKKKQDYMKILNNDMAIYATQQKIKSLYDHAANKVNGLNKKKINRIIMNYKTLLSLLEKEVKKDDIIDIDLLIDKIADEDIKQAVALFVFEHNKPYYEQVENEYLEKSSNSENKFIAYFNSIDIDFNSLSPKLKTKIMEDSLENVKKKIGIISKLVSSDQYISILVNSSLEKLLYIENLINKQYITVDDIKNNISILMDDNIYEIFKSNIEILDDAKVNFKKYSDKSFLLADNNILRSNIHLLTKYNIPFTKCNDLSFLSEPLAEKLSSFIEVGLENEILSNPDILNADADLAKRIVITKLIGEDIYTDGSLDKLVIYKDDFFVPANKVGEFILDRDNSKYNKEASLYLSNMDATPLSYIVDGVIVPKTRVHNQPVSLNDIIKPSLYTKEDIKILEKSASI